MGKPERKLKRASGVSKPPAIALSALNNLQALPELIQGIVLANKKLTDEQSKLKEIIGDILQEHENELADLKKRLEALEAAK